LSQLILVAAEEIAQQVRTALGISWLPNIYRERVLKIRTRSYHFDTAVTSKKARIDIQHSLLGVELKIGNRRLLCPDLATARYLAVFARAGVMDVAVPYDITRVSQLADELESGWYRMLLLADNHAADATEKMRGRIRGLLIAAVRAEILEAGAGANRPEFKSSTKQRN
jgi:hypothetical protein